MSKISDKIKKLLLNDSYFFWGLLFTETLCTTCAMPSVKNAGFITIHKITWSTWVITMCYREISDAHIEVVQIITTYCGITINTASA